MTVVTWTKGRKQQDAKQANLLPVQPYCINQNVKQG